MSNLLPQRGHGGRLKFSLARTRAVGAWQADWTIMVDPPRRTLPHRNPYDSDAARGLWRHRDDGVKLSWRSRELPWAKREF
jgi:hypothetical protein